MKPLCDYSHLLQIPNGFSRINMVTLWTFPWQIIWIGQKRNTDPGIKELKLQQRICKKMQHSRFAPDKSSEVVLTENWTESCTSESQPRNLDTVMIRKWRIVGDNDLGDIIARKLCVKGNVIMFEFYLVFQTYCWTRKEGKERLLREVNFHFGVYSEAGAGNMLFQSDKHSQVKGAEKHKKNRNFREW